MLHLIYSNRFEELISPLAASVRAAQTRAPLDRITIVVPNRVVEQYLKLRLAESEGIAANLHCPFLRRYLGQVVQKTDDEIRILDLKELQVVVFEALRTAIAGQDPELEALRSYVRAFPENGRLRELKLFQLCERIAWLFREYSIARGPMLKRWSREPTASIDSINSSESWQRRIWNTLFNQHGCLKPEWIVANDQNQVRHRWMMLPDAFAAIESETMRAVLPPDLHIFGLNYVGHEFLKILERIGSLIDLWMYTFNPCQEFWEDVSVRAPQNASPRSPRGGAQLELFDNTLKAESAEDNLALRHWGRAGRDYIRLLNELSDCDFEPHFTNPATNGQGNLLLAEVQRSILLRQPESSLVAKTVPDESIRFLLCPGVRREVEIVANAIWSLIRSDDKRKDRNHSDRLRFHQIAVLVPDSLRNSYLAHIESVFAQSHQIPVNFVERQLNAESRVVEAIDLLLKLPLGRFGRNELTRLLTHPVVAGNLAEEASERWKHWCKSLGVYFGADETAFAGTYIPPNLYHWDQALKRLALGLFMEGGSDGNERAFSSAKQREYLPYEVSEDAIGAAATMIQTARGLLCDAIDIAKRELSIEEWSKALGNLISRHIHPADRAGEQIRDLVLQAMDSMAAMSLVSKPVSYEIATQIALKQIANVESEQINYVEGGVVVGSLSVLHSIPFRTIFILGMGEADFPERERRDPLDLRGMRRSPGDVSPTERDRYMFLETLLAARDRLFISYVSRNALTGDPLEPSPMVRDLQLILRKFLHDNSLEQLSVEHPLSSYDRRYFHDSADPTRENHFEMMSFDRGARRGAQIVAMRNDLASRYSEGRIAREESVLDRLAPPVRDQLRERLRLIDLPDRLSERPVRELSLPLAALRRYLECPLQGAARYALGLFAPEDGDGEDPEEEPLDQNSLDRTMVLREALWRARGNSDTIETAYRDEFVIRELGGKAPTGPFAHAAEERNLSKLRLGLRQAAQVGVTNLDDWQQIAIGGGDEFLDVDRTLPEIILKIDVSRADGTTIDTVKLRGRVGPVSSDLRQWIRCVAGKKAKATDFLDGFLGAIVLSAAGANMPADFMAIAVGGDDDGLNAKKISRHFHPPAQIQALSYLEMLTRDLLSDKNHFFLPIEAVGNIFSGELNEDREMRDAVEMIRDNDFASCRSDFGPVADARGFPSYASKDLHEIIERRFCLLSAIFEK